MYYINSHHWSTEILNADKILGLFSVDDGHMMLVLDPVFAGNLIFHFSK